MSDPYQPCKIIEVESGYCLMFTEFECCEDTFTQMGKEGGGYGWHAVVDAMVRLKEPDIANALKYDPEASMFCAISKDRQALEKVGALIRSAVENPQLLKEAIENADPDLWD